MQNRDYVRAGRPALHPSRSDQGRSDQGDVALPPTILRSRAPGIVLAIVAIAALAAPIVWKVSRQTEAIHQAQNRPQVILSEPAHPPPPSALVMLPEDTSASGAQLTPPGTHVTLTGALVAAPSASVAPTAPTPSRAPAPSPAAAAAPPAARTATPAAAPHHTHHVYHHHASAVTTPAAPTAPVEDNPYDDMSSSSDTNSPPPAHDLDKPKD